MLPFADYAKIPTRKNPRGLSDHRSKVLSALLEQFQAYRKDTPLFPALLQFLAERTRECAVSTAGNYAAGLTAYFRFTREITEAEAQDIRERFPVTMSTHSSYSITADHVRDAIHYCMSTSSSRNTFSYLRDAMLIVALSATGARIGMALVLLNADAVMTREALQLTFTTSKKRDNYRFKLDVPLAYSVLGYDCRPIIEQYYTRRHTMPGDHFFCTVSGTAITARSVQERFQRIGEIVKADFNPHALRHYAAERIATKHGIHVAKKILAHSSTATTERYTQAHFTDDENTAVYLQ